MQQRGLDKRTQAYEARQHGRRLHVPAAGHRQIHHQVRMGEMPKDDGRAGVLSLAQCMEGGFDVGAGLLQLVGVTMGGRQPSSPG